MKSDWFSDIEEIVADDLRFKAALNIGEDAYTSLKLKNRAFELWDAGGAVAGGASIAASSVVASQFFSAGGILGLLGIGSAVTPIGWVIAAGVLAGGSWFGITRYFKAGNDKVTVIPKFINTPLDVLALSLFDLMAPLSMKIAAIDGQIADEEIKTIRNHFVENWGYSSEFTERGLVFTRKNIDTFSVKDFSSALATFTRENRDCNYTEMANAILAHLKEIAAADGKIHDRETWAIQEAERIFGYEDPTSLSRHLHSVKSTLSRADTKAQDASSSASKPKQKKTSFGKNTLPPTGTAYSNQIRKLQPKTTRET
jgi:uncharacterized tellurite resistance protein B-like protein